MHLVLLYVVQLQNLLADQLLDACCLLSVSASPVGSFTLYPGIPVHLSNLTGEYGRTWYSTTVCAAAAMR